MIPGPIASRRTDVQTLDKSRKFVLNQNNVVGDVEEMLSMLRRLGVSEYKDQRFSVKFGPLSTERQELNLPTETKPDDIDMALHPENAPEPIWEDSAVGPEVPQ